MSKMVKLRWTPITTKSGIWFDSNLLIVNGTSGVHIEMKGNGNEVTAFQSITGTKFVTCFQDYFGDVFDRLIPHPGIGQVMKFRVNKLPDYAVAMGNIEDAGNVDPENPEVPINAFAGSEGTLFRDIDSEILLGRERVRINP